MKKPEKRRFQSFRLKRMKCPFCKKGIDKLLVKSETCSVITPDIINRIGLKFFCPLCDKKFNLTLISKLYKKVRKEKKK